MADDRPQAPYVGVELEVLGGFLDFHRATALKKCEGLSDADLRRSLVASGTTPLGLIKHLAWVERYWFREVFRGEQGIPFPYSEDDPDAELRVEPHETTAEILALYRDACRESRASITGADPDDLAAVSDERVSLRWILVHMIEETARHNGHLDIIREQIDGATGE